MFERKLCVSLWGKVYTFTVRCASRDAADVAAVTLFEQLYAAGDNVRPTRIMAYLDADCMMSW